MVVVVVVVVGWLFGRIELVFGRKDYLYRSCGVF